MREQCEKQGLGVAASDVSWCEELLLAVRNGIWLTSGREIEFKCREVYVAHADPYPLLSVSFYPHPRTPGLVIALWHWLACG